MRFHTMAVLAILFVVLLSGCAPGPNELSGSPGSSGEIAGFWLGIWHGFIMLFTFIASLFSDSVSVYEAHNTGAWYNLGFVFGASLFFGGSGGA
ncbi:MAG: hypothetical protein HKN43_14875, partial [Rhodothermales bacterium]|nr:hypothetical protein [Rhodothermales bacterium]